MICFDDEGNEYWQSPEIPRRFFDWADHPLTDDDGFEGQNHYDNALTIDQACQILQDSPTIQASFTNYEDLAQVPIEMNEDLKSAGVYDPDTKSIEINPKYGLWDVVSILAHEIRHAEQDMEGLLLFNKKEGRRSKLLLYEADARAYEVTVAYELREKYPEVLDGLRDYNKVFKAMCDVFEASINDSPDNLLNGFAAQMALEECLLSKGLKDYYFQRAFGRSQFKRNMSDAKICRSLSAYASANFGMPFSVHDNGEFYEQDRYAYLAPERREHMIQAIKGKRLAL